MQANKYWFLVSYPKSGNTWCRFFISELLRISSLEENKLKRVISDEIDLFNNLKTGAIISNRFWFDDQIGIESSELTHSEIEMIRPNVHHQLWPYSESLRYHKVHDAFSKPSTRNQKIISIKNCQSIVYLIRNPLDIIISMENFFGWSRTKCINFLIDRNARLTKLSFKYTDQICQYLGDWENHVNSWTEQSEVPLSVFKYEDLLKSPIKEFTRLAKFLKLPSQKKYITKAVENCSFSKLKEREKNSFFIENSSSENPFFRGGRQGEGIRKLSKKEIAEIKKRFKNTLIKYNYY